MKILFTSDLHLKKKLLEGIKKVAIKEEVEVIVNTGDFLSQEFANKLAKFIEEQGIKGFFVEGNWDSDLRIYYSSVKLLKYDYERYKRYYFFGAYDKILLSYDDLLEMTKHIPAEKLIFLTHEPPQGILDKIWNNTHIGSEIYLEYDIIKKPRIHAFGHVHEGNGYIKKSNTLFINAAMNDIPICYIVDVNMLKVTPYDLRKCGSI